jgi:hypothetical protein
MTEGNPCGRSALRDLQRSFQRHVLGGDPTIVASVETRRVPAQARLGVYSEAYRLRLRDALASTFPRLQQRLGTAEFDSLAQRYIAEHPSQFTSLRWFGDRLAAALREWHPGQPWLSELAEWEWALASAFDAADASPLTVEALVSITPDQWPQLRFELHPSLQRLHLRTNAAALFKDSADEPLAIEPLLLDEPQRWMIWRQGLKTSYRSLDAREAAAQDAVAAGASFADLCELLCAWNALEDVPLRAASLLKGWLSEGLIVKAGAAGYPS